MSPRRPPSAVVPSVVLLALACSHASGPPPAEPVPAARPEAPAPVSAPPPPVVAALPVPAPAALPEPEVVLPEITTLALAREVLAREARRLDETQREQVARILADAEAELGLDALLVLALITQESRFDPGAVGPKGSVGLMQIRPFVGRAVAARYGLPWAGDATLVEPAHNVRIGTYYLAELFTMFEHDAEAALAAYNMGPYRMRRLLRQGREPASPFPALVFEHYDALLLRYGEGWTGWGG